MKTVLAGMLVAALTVGCATTDDEKQDVGAAADSAVWLEGGAGCTNPKADYDGDGLSNGQEGCNLGRDSDNDKTPDWQDSDSDNDKVPDSVEAGKKTSSGTCEGAPKGKDGWPCDSDGDKVPDYLDLDSDGDTVKDGEEDVNGDGLLGCCLTTCNKPGSSAQQKCKLNKEGCGGGQKCTSGKCLPAASFLCSEGETSPKKKDTFGDGLLDGKRGSFICRDATEDKPQGRKPVLLRQDKKGDWHLALETHAKYGPVTIANAGSKMAAATINYDKSSEGVAGFVISKVSTGDVQAELASLLSALNLTPPGGSGTVTVRASGTQTKSHDKYDMVEGTLVDVKLSAAVDVSMVRNQLIATLLGKNLADLTNLPASFGSVSTEYTIRFTTIKRFDFKQKADKSLVLDAKGFPIDSGDKTKWRLVVIGAVARDADVKTPTRRTGIVFDDLSNSTAVALASDKVGNECDASKIANIPIADIVWVSDESGSMNDNRVDIVNHANEFFKGALAMGLDFRMGITNVVPKNQTGYGKFCSRVSTNKNDSGGTDRFLLPSEQQIFSSCIKNPPGYTGGHSPGEYGLINAKAALTNHLPRAASDPSKFRKDAAIIFIILTDQIAAAVETVAGKAYKQCSLDPSTQAGVNSLLKPYVDLFTGVDDLEAVVSKFFIIGGVCSNKCNAMISHGYLELMKMLGGQIADVCQKNLSKTMQVFVNSIVANSMPVKLDYMPISSSLAVTVDGLVLKRSRSGGFDYRSASNSLVFINVSYKKGSQVFASYKRWERQVSIK